MFCEIVDLLIHHFIILIYVLKYLLLVRVLDFVMSGEGINLKYFATIL